MRQNAVSAATSHEGDLTDHQRMACQVIAQAVSITLSIRELLRQGYLFGGHVLLRALVERATLLLYLNLYPVEIARWKRGWHPNDNAPGLSKMLDAIEARQQHSTALGGTSIKGSELTAGMNSLLHGKPDSAGCDDLCVNTIPWLELIARMMSAYFPVASGQPTS